MLLSLQTIRRFVIVVNRQCASVVAQLGLLLLLVLMAREDMIACSSTLAPLAILA